ncbi:Fe-S cluster assembly ATPase SufC [Candidatus Woesearchaeota archaeon]|nr:Fe-S cluster assembly ATPase SufC [Candidatus Woesearchaeota archaeon]
MNELQVKDLHVEVKGKEILKGVSLTASKGEVVALMGPNGAGKSSFGYALMGHPDYKATKGRIIYNGKNITKLPPDERARRGLFLSFQHPTELPGVSIANFLRTAMNSTRDKKNPIPVAEFVRQLKEAMKALKMDESFMHRYLNDGFSGGEKKRAEILQMALLKPEMAILDETDSGLDVDSLKTVAEGINRLMNKNTGLLLITHYQRILRHVKPDKVYVMMEGKIIKTGGEELARQIENEGYESIKVSKDGKIPP